MRMKNSVDPDLMASNEASSYEFTLLLIEGIEFKKKCMYIVFS